MKRRWMLGAWALLGAPAALLLIGYSEQALYARLPNSWALLYIGAFLPGADIGLKLLALLSLVKSEWPRRIIAAASYGAISRPEAAARDFRLQFKTDITNHLAGVTWLT